MRLPCPGGVMMLQLDPGRPAFPLGHEKNMSSDLLSAAKNGYYDQVVTLLSSGVRNVDARDKDLATPLYWSASRGHRQICEQLIKAGCDVNACVKWGSTALHAAADRGHADCLSLLIASGANVNVQNQRGDTALHLAAYRGFHDIVSTLIRSSADPFTKNGQSKTPLQEAQSQQHVRAATVLQQYMESLGCHAFKSLPESDWSKAHQHQHLEQTVDASVLDQAGASWPRYQAFHKLPSENGSGHGKNNLSDTNVLRSDAELARLNTYPLRYNDLSADTGARTLPRDNGKQGGGGGVRNAGSGDRAESVKDMFVGGGELWGAQGTGLDQQRRYVQQRQDVVMYSAHPEPSESADDDHRRSDGVSAKYTQHARTEPGRVDVQSMHSFLKTLPNSASNLLRDGEANLSNHSHHRNVQSQPQAGLGGASRTQRPSQFSDLREMAPPSLPPPPHHQRDSGAGFVNHEDLTQFAESLQFEIVNLRDELCSKDQRVAELQASLTQVTQQQRESESRQRQAEALLQSKDSQLNDLMRRVAELERQNNGLQQTLVQQQARWKGVAEDKEGHSRELTVRIADLEMLNTSLQQVIVSQQESMSTLLTDKDALSGMLAARETELAALRDKLQEVTGGEVSPGVAAVPLKQQRYSAASDPPPDWSRALQAGSGDDFRGQLGVGDSDHQRVHDSVIKSAAAALASQKLSQLSSSVGSVTAGSVMSFCDRNPPSLYRYTLPVSPPYGQAHTPSATLNNTVCSSPPVYPFHAASATSGTATARTATTTTGPERTVAGSALSDSADPEQQLKAIVSRLFREEWAQAKLDADGREWTKDKEFSLLDSQPVNCADGQRRGSSSLVFSIEHKGRKYILKMLMNVLNLSQEAHSVSGRSLDAHLLHRFGAEFHAPLLLQPPHPNVVPVRHHYQGDTTHFRSYLPWLVPEGLDVPVEMARRTTFLVLDHYPQTLQSLFSSLQGTQGKPDQHQNEETRNSSGKAVELGQACTSGGERGGLEELPEQFMLQLTYQLLSGVEYLQSHGVVHRDIKADNVFLDHRLRPVLGDFGFARTLRRHGGEAVTLTDKEQVFAGNAHAWAPELCRLSRCDVGTLPQPLTLEEVYSKSDAYAVSRMMYSLLDRNNSDHFPSSSQQHPHYPDTAVPLLGRPVGSSLAHVLRNLVLDQPAHRMTARRALLSVGVLLCKGETDLSSPQSAQDFCSNRLRALASLRYSQTSSQSEERTLSVRESVSANQDHCLADVLLHFSGRDLWEGANGTYSQA